MFKKVLLEEQHKGRLVKPAYLHMQTHKKISRHIVNLLPSALSGIQIFLHLGHHFHFVAPESVTLCFAEKKPEQKENHVFVLRCIPIRLNVKFKNE